MQTCFCVLPFFIMFLMTYRCFFHICFKVQVFLWVLPTDFDIVALALDISIFNCGKYIAYSHKIN